MHAYIAFLVTVMVAAYLAYLWESHKRMNAMTDTLLLETTRLGMIGHD